MNRQQALRLAITALEFKRARYRHDAQTIDSPQFKAALKQVNEITQAIVILQKELDTQTRYPTEVKL